MNFKDLDFSRVVCKNIYMVIQGPELLISVTLITLRSRDYFLKIITDDCKTNEKITYRILRKLL